MDPCLELLDGGFIPKVGLAAFVCNSEEITKSVIKEKLAQGIRYFEIAELFSNGWVIAEALFESGVSRDEVYISLKVWPKQRNPEALFNSSRKYIEELSLGAVDLIMVHVSTALLLLYCNSCISAPLPLPHPSAVTACNCLLSASLYLLLLLDCNCL